MLTLYRCVSAYVLWILPPVIFAFACKTKATKNLMYVITFTPWFKQTPTLSHPPERPLCQHNDNWCSLFSSFYYYDITRFVMSVSFVICYPWASSRQNGIRLSWYRASHYYKLNKHYRCSCWCWLCSFYYCCWLLQNFVLHSVISNEPLIIDWPIPNFNQAEKYTKFDLFTKQLTFDVLFFSSSHHLIIRKWKLWLLMALIDKCFVLKINAYSQWKCIKLNIIYNRRAMHTQLSKWLFRRIDRKTLDERLNVCFFISKKSGGVYRWIG